jgi:hypothetical protein
MVFGTWFVLSLAVFSLRPQDNEDVIRCEPFKHTVLTWPHFRLCDVKKLVDRLQLTDLSVLHWFDKDEWSNVDLDERLEVASNKRTLILVHPGGRMRLNHDLCPGLEDEVREQTSTRKGKRRAAEAEERTKKIPRVVVAASASLACDESSQEPQDANDSLKDIDSSTVSAHKADSLALPIPPGK